MNTINWGIIGCGDVCEMKSGPGFQKAANSALVAVMRRDHAKARDYAARHHVPKYYTDADSLIADPEVNAVYVATPPSTHLEYAVRAMRAGKPVYVEKPMAMNFAECREMLKTSEKTGQKLFVAFYRRALPYFLKVKELLDSGAIGNPLTVGVQYFRKPSETDIDPQTHTWRVKKEIAGGGYFYDLAPHTLDILDFLLGEIDDAQAFTGNLGGFYEVEDSISAVFRFHSGVQGMGQWCFVSSAAAERDTVEITGTKGALCFNTFAFAPIKLITGGNTEFFQPEHPPHIQQPLIQSIVNDLRGEGKCPSTGVSGARTAWVMDKMFKVQSSMFKV